MPEGIWYWLVIVGVLALGTALFFLTGFIHIHKGYVGVIEEMGRFQGVFKPGYYYYHPLRGRRVGMYKSGLHVEDILFQQKLYRVNFQIVDYQAYHYAGHNLMGFIDQILLTNSEATIIELPDHLTRFGLKVEQIESHQ